MRRLSLQVLFGCICCSVSAQKWLEETGGEALLLLMLLLRLSPAAAAPAAAPAAPLLLKLCAPAKKNIELE